MNKKVIIISFTFAPSNKIGARRWTKFSKYFLKKGIDIQVITSKTNIGEFFFNELKLIKDRIHPISFNYPIFLATDPKKIRQKLLYRLSLYWSKINTNLNYYDRAVHGKKNLIKKVEEFLDLGYKNVIVSVAPFHMATHLCELIPKYPDVNFIVDFRDPWTYNKTAFGYFSMSKKRRELEDLSEKKVIETFSHVVTVAEKLTFDLSKKYDTSKAAFLTINNGFDKDDLYDVRESIESNKIKFVFTGTLYNNVEDYYHMFLDFLDFIKSIDIDLYEKIEINFYGDSKSKFITNHEKIVFHGFIDRHSIQQFICNADFGLLFLSDDINYSFSTKFIEYISYKLPVIIFSSQGETTKYVERNNIGLGIRSKNDFKNLHSIIKLKTEGNDGFYNEFDINLFDLEKITELYIKLLK